MQYYKLHLYFTYVYTETKNTKKTQIVCSLKWVFYNVVLLKLYVSH